MKEKTTLLMLMRRKKMKMRKAFTRMKKCLICHLHGLLNSSLTKTSSSISVPTEKRPSSTKNAKSIFMLSVAKLMVSLKELLFTKTIKDSLPKKLEVTTRIEETS